MKILSFDTTNAIASAAILVDGNILSYNTTLTNSQQAEKLFLLIEQCLEEAKLTFSDIDLVSVTNGPGSFTGVRIGLAAALGMQTASDTKFIALTNFQVLARTVQNQENKEIAVALDARREQIYLQKFSANLEAIDEPKLLNKDDLILHKNVYLVQDLEVDAKLLALSTEFYWQKQQYHTLTPLYVRQPDVNLKL